MYYERIRKEEEERIQEKENDSDIEEISMNQSSEDFQQLTNNKEVIQISGTPQDNYPKKDVNTYQESLIVSEVREESLWREDHLGELLGCTNALQ